jgi:glutathione peroxidase-family protein
MNPVQHLRLYDNAKALMSLVDGIIYFCGRKQILIVDAPGIDIPGMYSYFKENYNLHIFEKQTLRFEVKVYIGVPESCKDVTSLYYKDKLIVVGLPSNDFGGQEPGSSAEIAHFCKMRYGVSFPMTEKIHIKGPGIHPLYHWLTHKSENGVMDSEVKWNFQKYLLDENGFLEKVISPNVSPVDPEIISWIESK